MNLWRRTEHDFPIRTSVRVSSSCPFLLKPVLGILFPLLSKLACGLWVIRLCICEFNVLACYSDGWSEVILVQIWVPGNFRLLEFLERTPALIHVREDDQPFVWSGCECKLGFDNLMIVVSVKMHLWKFSVGLKLI